MPKKRKTLPPATRQAVLMEAGYKCGSPVCNNILTLEIHHMTWLKDDGSDDPSNLLDLCPTCHSLHTHGHIPEAAIRHWKGMLLALNHAFDRQSMDLLLFLHKTENDPIWYSGEGVLKFARLMAAGLVEFGGHTVATPYQVTESRHRIQLSEKGRILVETWKAGDEKRYVQMLMQSKA